MPAIIYVVPTDTCLGIGCRLEDTSGYELLYTMKGRDKSKKMAILLPTWDDLVHETTLLPAQVNFLRTYKFPFTVVCAPREDFYDEYPILSQYGYDSVGFRVAEACLSPETQSYVRSPLFLTSANKAGEEECSTIDEIKSVFTEHLDLLKCLPGSTHCQPSSNVIAFRGNTNDLQYFRKNYPLN